MHSFQQPADWWNRLAAEFQPQLDEIESRRESCRRLKARISAAVQKIATSGVLDARNRAQLSLDGKYPPYSPIEALSFLQRSHVGEQGTRYRETTARIHANHQTMTWGLDAIVELHRSMLPADIGFAGIWKQEENSLIHRRADGALIVKHETIHPPQVDEYIRALFARFDEYWDADQHPRLLLIAAFILDFFEIHPFGDGNGRTARLAMLWLLYRSGHDVFRYVSLESLMSQRRTEYLYGLYKSSVGWHENEHDLRDWAEFVIGVVSSAYDEALEAVQRIERTAASLAAAYKAIERMPDQFERRELMNLLPATDPALVDLLLNRRREAGRLEVAHEGATVRWRSVDAV
jgi:Fic family protein